MCSSQHPHFRTHEVCETDYCGLAVGEDGEARRAGSAGSEDQLGDPRERQTVQETVTYSESQTVDQKKKVNKRKGILALAPFEETIKESSATLIVCMRRKCGGFINNSCMLCVLVIRHSSMQTTVSKCSRCSM